jgi:hypothetical protein
MDSRRYNPSIQLSNQPTRNIVNPKGDRRRLSKGIANEAGARGRIRNAGIERHTGRPLRNRTGRGLHAEQFGFVPNICGITPTDDMQGETHRGIVRQAKRPAGSQEADIAWARPPRDPAIGIVGINKGSHSSQIQVAFKRRPRLLLNWINLYRRGTERLSRQDSVGKLVIFDFDGIRSFR